MAPSNVLQAIKEAPWPPTRTQMPQVRIEVNFKCGKACFYCRPTGEGVAVRDLRHTAGKPVQEMGLAQLIDITAILSESGVSDFKLTGGDPMLRSDIVDIVRGMKSIPGVKSLHLVTRHELAGSLAGDLKAAGLDMLNFSIDSLDPVVWQRITRVQGHERLIQSVRDAAATGIPLKLNTVVMKGVNDQEIPALIEFAGELGAELKLLDLIGDIGVYPGFEDGFVERYYADLSPVVDWLAETAVTIEIVTQPGGLGHPMPRFMMPNGAIVTVKSGHFGAYYGSICDHCPLFPCWDALMALRVTPNGMLQFCLLRSDNLIDLRALLENGDVARAKDAVNMALGVYRTAKSYTGEQISIMRREAIERRDTSTLRLSLS